MRPLEFRPANPIPKGPRPGSRNPPHQVQDNETLESVAKMYGISVQALMMHNFGTTVPKEVNWYLRENVGCNLPTKDGLNWRFSKSADPGKIYIPQNVITLPPITLLLPTKLNLPGPPVILASQKFTHEFSIPPDGPHPLDYFLVQAKIIVEGEIKQKQSLLPIKASFKSGQVKLAVEKELSEVTKATFGLKLDEKSLKPIAEAVSKGSKDAVLKAIAAPFEASIKTSYRWNNMTCTPEFGLQASKTPVVIRLSGDFEDDVIVDDTLCRGKFAVKIGFNVGLSPKGWTWVADKVGRPVLQRFATVAEFLVAEGVLTAGAVVVGTVLNTLAITSLMAWLVQNAKHKADLNSLALWYVSAYSAKVFREPRPSDVVAYQLAKLRDEMVVLGEKDALLDARSLLTKIGHSAARGSDSAALEAYRELMLDECKRNLDDAKRKLRMALEAKAKRLAGF